MQPKEAGQSVLEDYLSPSPFSNHGERVVAGQRTMQARAHYYVRQPRDMKGVPDLENMGDSHLAEFARFCGWTLAAAHARSGHAAQIAGYLGSGAAFVKATVRFASAYADIVETIVTCCLRRSPTAVS